MAKKVQPPTSMLEQKLLAALSTCRGCASGLSFLEDLAAVSPELIPVVQPIREKHTHLDTLARVGLAALKPDDEQP